jgi:molecular chaperone DnaK
MRRNKATGLIYSTERTLEEFGGDIDATDQEAVRKALEDTTTLANSEDFDSLNTSVETLSVLTYQMTEKLYAALGDEDANAGLVVEEGGSDAEPEPDTSDESDE